MAKRGRKKAYKYSTEPIKVGDWVYPTNVQIYKMNWTDNLALIKNDKQS